MKQILDLQRNIRVEIEMASERPFYSMNYYGDDRFEQYLQCGAQSLEEYCTLVDTLLFQGDKEQIKCDSFGCSAFIARDENGDILFARNMDSEKSIPMLVRMKNGTANKSLFLVNMIELDWDEATYNTLENDAKLTLAAAYSPCDGINEYGLVVAILTDATAVYPKEKSKVTLFDLTLPRLLLDKAKTVNEAIEYVKNYNLFYGFAPLHYMVADATGDAAVIEFVDGEMVVTRKEAGLLIVSNFTLYSNPNREGFGKERYENYQNALAKSKGIISEADALELLKNNTIPGDEQWSVVYNLSKRSLAATFSKDYEKVYYFSLR